MADAEIIVKSKLKGEVLNSHSRRIVSNVYHFMKEETKIKIVTILFTKSRFRAAAATGLGERIVIKINTELNKITETEEVERRLFQTLMK